MNTLWKRLKIGFGHAFAVSQKREAWRPEEIALMEKIAHYLVERGMAQPAILFLESVAPLNFLGSQALHTLSPLLGLVDDPLKRMASILERRDSIAFFINLIEQKIDAGCSMVGERVEHRTPTTEHRRLRADG